ncbi:hypothetical protein Lesp02_04190 [Lentzea sp. NBRC 105346]|uniref:RNA polymerase sigma factor n=1 Tax=Lentzea sp. NBRC 105346 TaxID=3032205 RepID=UPI0024A4EC88|nr:sigma-70 family RNA polymerase sigma factor [Lentzea sp. NBRC 105346]GLZ28229.1 hypothetical protein Lesp02_04190 [Lentzea sp. NBRC 105346]
MTDARPPVDDDSAQRAFTEFFDGHYREVHQYVHSHWPQFDSESIVNATFEKVWKSWEHITGDRIKWAMRVAKNLAIDAWRRHEVPMSLADIDEHMVGAGMLTAEAGVEAQQINEALGELPPRLRTALLMHAYGWSREDIAEAMNCKPASVSHYLSQARDRMADLTGKRFRRRGRGKGHGPAERTSKPDGSQDHGADGTAAVAESRQHRHDDEEN